MRIHIRRSHASCLRESGGWRWKERARELNGVLVRAVGSSGSTARRRLPVRFSIGRTRDSGAGRACNDVEERGKRTIKNEMKNTSSKIAKKSLLRASEVFQRPCGKRFTGK